MKEMVLVSGGAGYIGSHTAVELINAGYDVVVADNLSNADMSGVDGVRKITGVDVPFVEVDCCDKEAFRKVFKQYNFNSVIHFAAYKAVGESVTDPMKYYRNNLTSFLNVLELMREEGRQNVVFSSSATVYGEADELPVTELTPRKPATSSYGNTKQICEDILRDVATAYGDVKGISLRYFNPIGAHPSALIGELPRAAESCALRYADSCWHPRVPERLWRRLSYTRRLVSARLYRRSGSGEGSRCGYHAYGRGQEQAGIRGVQRRHRQWRVG